MNNVQQNALRRLTLADCDRAKQGGHMTPFILETSRLIIRAFQADDLRAIHRILDQTFGAGSKIADEEALNERRSWLEQNPLPDPPWLQVVGTLQNQT